MQEEHKVFILCEVLCAHDSCMGFSLIGWKMLNVFLLMHTSLNDSSKAIILKHKVFILCTVLCMCDSCMHFSLIGWKNVEKMLSY